MPRTGKRDLPSYDAPPVIETVLGVEFAPLVRWGIPHFGLFWSRIRDEFPRFEVKAPLASQIEQFEWPVASTPPSFQFLDQPEVRCWFVGADNRTLVQVQHDRFTYNWRKAADADKYPRYEESIRPAFVDVWHSFSDLVAQEKLGALAVVQCEVTYVNHIEIGRGWSSAAEMGNVFTCWHIAPGEFLPVVENAGFTVNYRMPEKQGRLRVAVSHAIRKEDATQVLVFTLTARGKPKGSNLESVLQWLDMGREWVVRGFTDLTTPAMHSMWERSV